MGPGILHAFRGSQQTMRPHSQHRAPTLILGALVFMAPLLFGAVYPWAYGLLEIGVLAAFLLCLWRGDRVLSLDNGLPRWGLWCLLAFVAWAGVQLIPLPQELVRLVAQPVHDLWQLDFLPAGLARPRALLPLSLYPYATASTGLLFLCYALAFLMAWRLASPTGGEPVKPGALLLTVVLAGFAVAAVAIVQNGLDARAMYGFFPPRHGGSFTGPYVNYNHFAGYLEMAIPLGVGVVAFVLRNRLGQSSAPGLGWLCGGAAIIMMAALFMSRSRGGILAFGVVLLGQLLVIAALLSRSHMKKRLAFFSLVLVLLLGVGAHMTDWSQTLPRFHRLFHQEAADSIRWQLYKDVLHMSNQLPLTGSGLGTFYVGFPPFKTIPRQGVFRHAHNDFLEVLAETGWPGLLMFLGFVAWVLARGGGVLRRAMSRRGRGDPELIGGAILLTGCLGGVVSLLIHGLVDFNLRIPANALTWFVLCGLVVGLSQAPPAAAPLEQDDAPSG